MTIVDRVFHYRARWLRQLARSLRQNRAKTSVRVEDVRLCKPQMPQPVLNGLIKQGFSLIMKGNLANASAHMRNYRENPTILKGKREYRVVNEGELWWAVPVEGEIAEGERIFPFPFSL